MSSICKLLISNASELRGQLIFNKNTLHRFGLNEKDRVVITYSDGNFVVKPDSNGVKFCNCDYYPYAMRCNVNKSTLTKANKVQTGVIEFHKATKHGNEIRLAA